MMILKKFYQKKSLSIVLILVFSVFSLQSCVSNYMVAMPSNYNHSANFNSLNAKKISEAKIEISNSQKIDHALAKVEDISKDETIKKAIQHSDFLESILAEAKTYIGTPYRYGGMSRNGIDCSAFVLSVFSMAAGINLPRVAAAQAKEGEKVEKDQLKKGDLLFFSHGSRISHVGIVEEVTEEGDVKFIHAASSNGVMISSLKDSYWSPKFRFAKRIISNDAIDINTSTKEKEDYLSQIQNLIISNNNN